MSNDNHEPQAAGNRPGGIAIVGMAGRFPEAANIGEFWRNLTEGRDCIARFNLEELAREGVADALLKSEHFVPAGAVLDDIESFDAELFGISPREAESMDPQQRIFLEVVQEAFDDAGVDPERAGGPVAVYAGSFYLARPDLIDLQVQQTGFVEGGTPGELIRYFRHEMGHVVNYGYKLYEREDWTRMFGSIDQPYVEEYRPEPFHRSFVQHLPGWYAQKHPDEDWAETFAVWMTPGLDWRQDYARQPHALAKLTYCDSVMAELAEVDPVVTSSETDTAVETMTNSLQDYYRPTIHGDESLPSGLDASLRTIFLRKASKPEGNSPGIRLASSFLRAIEPELVADIYRWTGHFPERTRVLMRYLAQRADELELYLEKGTEIRSAMAMSTILTALAMNHVLRGSYTP